MFVFTPQPCARPHVPPDMVCIPAAFLRDVLRLAHPDVHNESRRELAERVTKHCSRVLAEMKQAGLISK